MAFVNGQAIPRYRLNLALQTREREVLEQLIGTVILEQAARKAGVTAPSPPPIPSLGLTQAEAAEVQRQRQLRELRRSIVLQSVSEHEMAQLLADFGDDFTRYDLQVVALRDALDARDFVREIKEGQPFEKMVAKYSLPVGLPQGNRLLGVTPSDIANHLGPYAAEATQRLWPGGLSPATASPFGPVVIRLDARHADPAQARRHLEEVLVDARQLALDYELASKAHVYSPIMPELSKRISSLLETPGTGATAKPPPVATPSPTPMAEPDAAAHDSHPALPEQAPTPQMPVWKEDPPSLPRPIQAPVGPRKVDPPPVPLPILQPQVASRPRISLKAEWSQKEFRLIPQQRGSKTWLRLDLNNNHHAEDQEPVLVRLHTSGWQWVEALPVGLDRFTLEQDYGYWVDRPGGGMRLGPLQVTPPDHPPNGSIDPGEVQIRRLAPLPENPNLFDLGAEIYRDEKGRLFHREQWARFSPRTPADKEEIQKLKDYRESDFNWTVERSS